MVQVVKDERIYERKEDKILLKIDHQVELTLDEQWQDFKNIDNQLKQVDARINQMETYLKNNQIDKDIENFKAQADKQLKELMSRKENNQPAKDLEKIKRQKEQLIDWGKKLEATLKEEIKQYQEELRENIKKLKLEKNYDNLSKEDKHKQKTNIFPEAMNLCTRKIEELTHPVHKEIWEEFDRI
jgi:exonuclease VII large subunit